MRYYFFKDIIYIKHFYEYYLDLLFT